jgi:hypothetical protein
MKKLMVVTMMTVRSMSKEVRDEDWEVEAASVRSRDYEKILKNKHENESCLIL